MIILSEVQSDRQKEYPVVLLICGLYKQNDASELIYKAETPAGLENELMVVWEGRGWEGRDG